MVSFTDEERFLFCTFCSFSLSNIKCWHSSVGQRQVSREQIHVTSSLVSLNQVHIQPSLLQALSMTSLNVQVVHSMFKWFTNCTLGICDFLLGVFKSSTHSGIQTLSMTSFNLCTSCTLNFQVAYKFSAEIRDRLSAVRLCHLLILS